MRLAERGKTGDGQWSFASLVDPDAMRRAERLNPDWKDDHKDDDKDKGSRVRKTESCYRDAGRYLAINTDILIALWDGVYVGRTGGTSDTILYALSLECQEKRAREGRPPLEVHWLAIPRLSNPHPAGEAFTWQRLSVPYPASRSILAGLNAPAESTPVLLPVTLAVGSIACSLLGYILRPSDAPVDGAAILDRALTAIGHLAMNGIDSAMEGPWAWLVRIGRWLAVGFASTSIGIVMNELFRWQDDLVLWRTRHRKHDLVIGLGRRGRGIIEESGPGKIPKIAVDRSPSGSAKHACARMGVPLVEGDATDPETLRKVGMSDIACAFVVCDTDETNIQVVRSWRGRRTALTSSVRSASRGRQTPDPAERSS